MPPVSVCVFIICLASGVFGESLSDLYYWREYTGVVPDDALPAGRDADGRDAYIGEAYIHGHGLYISQIYRGVKEVEVPAYGPKTANINIKILCTESPEYFQWIPATAKTYDQDIVGLEVVKAGYDNVGNSGYMNVGRLFFQGHVIVGDVTPYASRKNNVQLWYPFMKVERAANFYELLTVGKPLIDRRLGMSNHISAPEKI